MKTFRIFLIPMLLTALLAGCSKDKGYFNQQPNPDPEPGAIVGYLDLSEFVLEVTSTAEEMPSGGAVSSPAAPGTRAEKATPTFEATDDYLVTITNSKTSESVFSGTYAALKEQTTSGGGKLTLAPGTYTIKAQSANFANIPAVDWETPAYSGSYNFTILKNTTTTLSGSNFVCTLGNIKTTVSLSADLDKMFKPDTDTEKLTTTLSLGSSSIDFGRSETRPAYFKAEQASNKITVRLRGQYNKAPGDSAPEYTPVDWKQEIPGCKAGQWRNITITILNTDMGNVQFQLTVETWTYDKPIDVDIMQYYMAIEEVIPDEEISDENAPVVSLDGKDITKVFNLSSSDFDFDVNVCTNMITTVASPVAGSTVEKFDVVFDSDNAEFLAALAKAGYSDYTVSLWPEAAENPLKSYVVMKQSGNDLMAKVTFAGMKAFYDYEGTHSVKFVTVDSERRTSYTKMTIKSTHGASTEVGPGIVWTGYDFDTRYSVKDPGLTIEIDITSKTGITGFTININSDLLTQSVLQEIDLDTEMDLINPATQAMEDALKGETLNFPVRDDVKGKTTLKFDITKFIPLMSALGDGYCDFTLNVTDESGTNSKTIQLTVEQ